MVSTTHYSLKAESWKLAPNAEWWPKHSFQGQERGQGDCDCPNPAHRSTGSHIHDRLPHLSIDQNTLEP